MDREQELDSFWQSFVGRFIEQIEAALTARLTRLFERFFRSGIKLVYTEQEAADMLQVSIFTLRNYRKAKTINFYQYNGRATYGLHHLQGFVSMHEHKNVPNNFAMKTDVSLWGTESVQKEQD